jgi:hypothetical protein
MLASEILLVMAFLCSFAGENVQKVGVNQRRVFTSKQRQY